jgi:hypothetical protein
VPRWKPAPTPPTECVVLKNHIFLQKAANRPISLKLRYYSTSVKREIGLSSAKLLGILAYSSATDCLLKKGESPEPGWPILPRDNADPRKGMFMSCHRLTPTHSALRSTWLRIGATEAPEFQPRLLSLGPKKRLYRLFGGEISGHSERRPPNPQHARLSKLAKDLRFSTDSPELTMARWGVPSSQFARMQAPKKRAAKLEQKGKRFDFKKLLRISPDLTRRFAQVQRRLRAICQPERD